MKNLSKLSSIFVQEFELKIYFVAIKFDRKEIYCKAQIIIEECDLAIILKLSGSILQSDKHELKRNDFL